MDGDTMNGHEITATNAKDSTMKAQDAEMHRAEAREEMTGANTGSVTEKENVNATGSDITREGMRGQRREKETGGSKTEDLHPGALLRRVHVRALKDLDQLLALNLHLLLTRQSPTLHRLVF